MKRILMMMFLLAAFLYIPAALADKAKSNTEGRAASAMNCGKCAKVCEETLSYFKKQGGKYTEAKNLQILKDCISSCKTSDEFQSRKSSNAGKIMAVCNEICKQCAQMCKDMNDPKLADCIKSCETCSSCCE